MGQAIGAGVLKYKSLIWRTADTLRGTGVKESDYPSYMAPFFALALVESRIKRLRTEKMAEFESETGTPFNQADANHIQWLQINIQNEGYGYHPDIAQLGVGLAELVKVKTGNFYVQVESFLKQFDPETKRLLGVDYAPGQPKFLDIKGIALDLSSRPNDPLFTFCAGAGDTPGWAHVDLVEFDNSEVTTLEEHIKRMWADISAETAGEQYTPKDLIALACALGIEARRPNTNSSQICDVYDMACGGGNFLFAAEEALRKEFPGLSVRVRGQELNDALYALAALEARFRPDAQIAWGNTLTHDHYLAYKSGFIVANPPYGVDWKAFAATIKTSNCGRFDASRMPPTSDGQLLFLQHAVFHLEENGVGAIVHSGSTLFSGDAGGGESETRRWLFQEQDVVEAIVQLPKNEFFNTGIATYLWILNRNKPESRKGKVLLINAETCFKKLKKNLNMKNCEIDPANRTRILDCFKSFTDSDISRVMDVDDLLYNKVSLELHRHDEEGRAIQKSTAIDAAKVKSIVVDGMHYSTATGGVQQSASSNVGPSGSTGSSSGPLTAPVDSTDGSAKVFVDDFNGKVRSSEALSIELLDGSVWTMNREEHRIQEAKAGGVVNEHGLGVLSVKAKVAKSKAGENIRWDISVDPFMESDTETIPYSSRKDEHGNSLNDKLIADFIAKWVRDPSTIKAKSVGSEINFNRVFPKLAQIRASKDLLLEIALVDESLRAIEEEMSKFLTKSK
ncbi:SAM-dependent methyltransferase [Rhodoferax aquaticus]|uniref:site-specific DNA-methyltransferase (adenine-specific) n=1 Tax=Rhodoferax aquaticus TaxID=2527691 RepID=A0A515EVU9_9BURK|nr:SAM-dependent methyltransferase [Rhodoferax aquaticus]